ncbi:MAG: sigma-54-dependent Fis family transcriptional regulator [Chitinophagaceae bacterium]|nr:sigma-54-dependent Fis family transcriptional regulator [Chitinophagaceae bacterium]
MKKILVVDDEKSIRKILREIFETEGYKVEEAQDGFEAINLIRAKKYDCILCDIKMPKPDGMEILHIIKKEEISVPIIMISGHGTTEDAVEAVKLGAFDFITKPPDLNRLLITVRNALDLEVLVKENKSLKQKQGNFKTIIIGESKEILSIKDMIKVLSTTEARVLITGDNGTGKELVAKQLHETSSRAKKPFVEVNCAAIPSELIESELFGHEKGSFTGAIHQKSGKFFQANGGTLFLDEIGDMSLRAQATVLRALQEGKISAVGSEKDIEVDVRVLAATNKNLLEEVEKGNFRLDLYHRLNVVNINVPALNDRREDIPILIEFFLEEICKEYKNKKKTINPEAVILLQNYNWTGNIRELKNIIERLVIFTENEITVEIVKRFVPQI